MGVGFSVEAEAGRGIGKSEPTPRKRRSPVRRSPVKKSPGKKSPGKKKSATRKK